MPDEDSIPNEVLEMPDQHSFGYIGNAPAQFTGVQGAIGKPPKNRPLPTPVDNRQHGINRAGRQSFFDTGIFLLSVCCHICQYSFLRQYGPIVRLKSRSAS
jgi:hypothetical protein